MFNDTETFHSTLNVSMALEYITLDQLVIDVSSLKKRTKYIILYFGGYN